MICPKKLIKIARKWQKIAATGSKRISFPSTNGNAKAAGCNRSSSVADKGHFVIYTTDERRFVMPLSYLKNNIFRELFKMSEQEFGVSSDGPITLPCDAMFMNYIILLLQRGAANDLEKALLNSISTRRCLISDSSSHQKYAGQHLLVCSC